MSAIPVVAARSRPMDAATVAFLAAAATAPIDVSLLGSFTLSDLLIVTAGVLVAVRGSRFVILPRGMGAAALALLVSGLASTFRATHPGDALTQVLQFTFIFLVQLPVILTIARERRVAYWSLVIFVGGSLAGGIVALVTKSATGADRFLTFYSDNPNRLGYPSAYVLPFLLLAIMWAFRQRHTLTLVVCAAALYVSAWALAASASRGAAVATLVAATTFLVFRSAPNAKARLVRIGVAVALLGSLAFVVLQTNALPSTLRDRIDASLLARGSLQDNRLRLDAAGIRAFVQSPLVGTGLDNFRYVAREYGAASDQAPHSMWVQFLAQVGLVGAIAMAYFILRWFVEVIRAARRAGGGSGPTSCGRAWPRSQRSWRST